MRTNPTKYGWLLSIGAIAASLGHAQASPDDTLVEPDRDGWIVAVGDPAPPLAFTDGAGQTRTLAEFAGKPVVILFWGTT